MSELAVRAQGALAILLSLPVLLWGAELVLGTPPLILAAAVTPAALFSALLIRLQRGSGPSRGSLAFALAWGGLGAAFLSTNINELAQAWLDPRIGDTSRSVTMMLVAPFVEEAAKGMGLVLIAVFAASSLRSPRDGVVLGALVGIGFVCTENLLYLGLSMLQKGEGGLLRSMYLRGLIGAGTHAVFTACVGAGLGWRRAWRRPTTPRFAAPVLGFVLATGQHIAWNGFAAKMIYIALCGAEVVGGACLVVPHGFSLFVQAPLVALAFLAPGACLIAFAWRAPHEPSAAAPGRAI